MNESINQSVSQSINQKLYKVSSYIEHGRRRFTI